MGTAMYRSRQMTPAEREDALKFRQVHRLPWHGPPHFENDAGLYLLTAACYEHAPVVGMSTERMAEFEVELLNTIAAHSSCLFAWVLLPNHYHVLARIPDLRGVLGSLGNLHGRTAYRWNALDGCRGRHVWHRVAETGMKSERHFWATLNYVLHNAVRHGYVEHWQDWPFSNATRYLDQVGREEAERRWQAYPLLDYGAEWDPPSL
jgi:putative transposase